MALLARLWQMLLKGSTKAGKAPNPLAAAEMVLIRIALYVRPAAARRGDPPCSAEHRRRAGRASSRKLPGRAGAGATAQAAVAEGPAVEETGNYDSENPGDFDFAPEGLEGDSSDEDGAVAPASGHTLRTLSTFADVVALAGDKRDAKLRIALEDQVSLVRYDGASGRSTCSCCLARAATSATSCAKKLNKWTGRRWIVALSKVGGGGLSARCGASAKRRRSPPLRRHPAVAAVLAVFPDAEVSPGAAGRARTRRRQQAGYKPLRGRSCSEIEGSRR